MATIAPPSNLTYGWVQWQAGTDGLDGPDADQNPDFAAPTGTVTFFSNVDVRRNSTASPNPISLLRDGIVGVLDEQGYLCTPNPDGSIKHRGLKLVATDDPDLNPAGWLWHVVYDVVNPSGSVAQLQEHDLALPGGETVDLTNVAPVDSARPSGTPQAEAAAAVAQQKAVEAQAAAAVAQQKATQAQQSAANMETASDATVFDRLANGTQSKTFLDGRFARRGLAEDLVPTISDTAGSTRILTPEAAGLKYSPRGEALFVVGKAFDPADNTAAAYGVLGTGHAWGWLLDPASNEAITAEIPVPEHWTSIIAIEPWWVQTTGDSGNVVWRTNVFNLSHNNSLTSGGGSTVTSAASPTSTTAARVRTTTIATALTVDPIKLPRIWLQRFASDAGDTYPADVGVIGIKITGV